MIIMLALLIGVIAGLHSMMAPASMTWADSTALLADMTIEI